MLRAVIGTLALSLWVVPPALGNSLGGASLSENPLQLDATSTDPPAVAKRKKKRRKRKRTKTRKGNKPAAAPELPTVPPVIEPQAPPDLPLMAVLPLGGTDLSLSDLGRLNAALRDAITKTDRFRLQPQAVTDDLVASSQALGVDCAGDREECADQLATLAGAGLAVVGRAVFIAPTGGESGSILQGQIGLHLAMIAVDQGRTTRRLRSLLPADPNTQPEALRRALEALLDDSARLGGIKLTAEPDGAEVRVDGVVLGTTPLGEQGGLLPGAHVVEMSKDGFLPRRLTVQIGTSPQEVFIILDEDESLRVEREIAWWEVAGPWSLVGAGGLGTAVGIGLLSTAAGLAAQASLTFAYIGTLDEGDANYPSNAAAAYQDNRVWRETFDLVGLYLLLSGAIVSGAGLLLAGTGAGWGTYYLLADADAEPE